MNNYSAFFIVLIISSVWVSSSEAQFDLTTVGPITKVTTPAAPSCIMNGRFADLTDPCRQSYITCLWIGTGFLTWPSKCPNKLVFNQKTSTCMQSSTPLPAICEPATTTTTPVPTTTTPTTSVTTTTVSTTTMASMTAAPSCVMNGRFADTSDPCGQTYILCSWDGTQFLSWTLKCPNNFIFYQITSECVESKTTLPPNCGSQATVATPVATVATPAVTVATPAATSPTPATSPTSATTSSTPATTSPTPATTSPTPATTSPTPATTSPTPATTSPTPATTSATTAASTTTTTTTAAPMTTPTTTAAPVTTTVTTTTTAAPSCTANGRFADPSDPCGQAYIMCSWDGTKFFVWKLKCPNKLVFSPITARCVRPTTALPDTC